MTTKVSLCVLNPRSACNKTSEIYDHIQEHDIDIMVLTESWLTGKDKDIVVIKALTPDGYSLFNSHRKTGRGGGIALVHKSSFNFHMDDSNDHHSKRLTDLLNCHGMRQYVNEPTHVGGHILDLIISRPQASVTDVMVKDLFEDHYAVHCHIDLGKPPFPREERVYRKIKSIKASCFSSDILKSVLYHDPEISLDGLVRQYNSTLSDLLNNHASLKRKLITIRPSAP